MNMEKKNVEKKWRHRAKQTNTQKIFCFFLFCNVICYGERKLTTVGSESNDNNNNKHFLSTFIVITGEEKIVCSFFLYYYYCSFVFLFIYLFFPLQQIPHSFICNNSYFWNSLIYHGITSLGEKRFG